MGGKKDSGGGSTSGGSRLPDDGNRGGDSRRRGTVIAREKKTGRMTAYSPHPKLAAAEAIGMSGIAGPIGSVGATVSREIRKGKVRKKYRDQGFDHSFGRPGGGGFLGGIFSGGGGGGDSAARDPNSANPHSGVTEDFKDRNRSYGGGRGFYTLRRLSARLKRWVPCLMPELMPRHLP